jgi:hypothetical protein
MSTHEAKNRTQTLPYLSALLTHPTPNQYPKSTQKDILPTPIPKKRLHKHKHKYAQHNPSMNNNLQQKTARLALLRQNSTPRAVIQKTNQQTHKTDQNLNRDLISCTNTNTNTRSTTPLRTTTCVHVLRCSEKPARLAMPQRANTSRAVIQKTNQQIHKTDQKLNSDLILL